MTEQIGTAKPVAFFEYELFEGDPDHLRTVKATPTQTNPWIDLSHFVIWPRFCYLKFFSSTLFVGWPFLCYLV